jgi:S-adenosylmethionine decarboxylase
MFNSYESSGKHMICDLKNIKNTDLLNNCDKLKKMMQEICTKYDFEILNRMEYVFQPIGCSILFLLSESHISIHTFPEKKHISFDLYTCRQYDNDEVYNKIYDFLIKHLDASINESKCQIINRYF